MELAGHHPFWARFISALLNITWSSCYDQPYQDKVQSTENVDEYSPTRAPIRPFPGGLDCGGRNPCAGRRSVPDQDCFNSRLNACQPWYACIAVLCTLGLVPYALTLFTLYLLDYLIGHQGVPSRFLWYAIRRFCSIRIYTALEIWRLTSKIVHRKPLSS